MGRAAGLGLRGISTFLYALEFCCAGVIVAIFAYFLARLSYNDLAINPRVSAVEGMSGAAVIYTAFAVIFTCFLGGVAFFALIAILFDLLFCGAFIAIAYFTRSGTYSCVRFNTAPAASGASTYGVSALAPFTSTGDRICDLNKVCFALAVATAVFFLLSALIQIFVWQHHKKEKRYGPSPSNDYTSGSGRWRRKRKVDAEKDVIVTEPVEPVHTVPAVVEPVPVSYPADRAPHVRPSHETGYTDTTAVAPVDTYAAPRKVETVAPEEMEAPSNHVPHVQHIVPVIPVGADSEQTGHVNAANSSQYGNFRGLTPGQIAVGPTGHLPVEDGPLDHGALRGGYQQYSAGQAYGGNDF